MKDYTPEIKKNQPTEQAVTVSFYTDLFKGTIEEIARKGAQKMLQMALELHQRGRFCLPIPLLPLSAGFTG